MKYLNLINENTLKNLIEKEVNLKVEKLTYFPQKCVVILKATDYSLNLKFEINSFEAISLNENINTKTTKQLTNLIRNLFLKYFNQKYNDDLNKYLSVKEYKFLKNLRNLDIENIFSGYKVLKITRKEKAIEVTATNNLNKNPISCYITNFKIINSVPKNKTEIKKIEKNFYSFMVAKYGQKYIEALIINENKKDESMNKC